RPLDLGTELDAALAAQRPIQSALGALAAAARLEQKNGAGEWAVVAGMRVPSDFFMRVEQVGEGLGFYHRFGVLRDVSRAYGFILVGALALALVGVALVVATRLAASMTRPLRTLEQALDNVAAGDLETRVAVTGARE